MHSARTTSSRVLPDPEKYRLDDETAATEFKEKPQDPNAAFGLSYGRL